MPKRFLNMHMYRSKSKSEIAVGQQKPQAGGRLIKSNGRDLGSEGARRRVVLCLSIDYVLRESKRLDYPNKTREVTTGLSFLIFFQVNNYLIFFIILYFF